MSQGRKHDIERRVSDDLEPYRRLIELQKQMIELTQKHEQSRREFEAFREQVTQEIAARMREKRGLNLRLRAAVSRLSWFNQKQIGYAEGH